MKSLGYCITHDHDLRLLTLAVVLTVLTLLTSSTLFRRAARRSRVRPELWVSLGALCVASGVWSVHFVAMLAYLPGLPIGFRAWPTLASFAVIVSIALLAFLGGEKAAAPLGRALAGGLFGLGVSGMHYVGMTALEAPGRFSWAAAPVAVSVALACGFGALGFVVGVAGVAGGAGRRIARWRLPVGGALIALGVLLLHFTGMAAISFRFDPRVAVQPDLISRPLLAVLVTALSSLVLTLGAFAAYQEHRDRRQALQRLKLLSASSFEGVALLREDRITEVNTAFAEAVGLERKVLIGQLFQAQLFTPDTGQSFARDGRTEGRLRGAKGRSVPVEVLAREVGAGGDLIVAVRDLTERRQKEQSLSLLFHRNPAPVWVSSLEGRLLAVNPAALALYGYDEAAFLKLKVGQLLPPREYAAVRRLAGEVDRYAPDRVWRHLRSDGAELLVLPYTETITFEGRPGYLTTVFDVTERERSAQALHAAKEAAEAASRAKSTFLANMSHEIRTPLNGVLGMSQAIASGELSAVQRQRLEVVLQSGQTLLHLLNDLLDVSKIEAGRVELEVTDFDLRALVGDLEVVYRVQAEAKGLAFRVEVDPAVQGRYRGDPTRLGQILGNLISNAVKFTSRGAVGLTIDAQAEGRLRFGVSDTGEGIEAAVLERLFQTFTQADPSTTRRHGGTGLGLSISRDLARLMGGGIEVQSRIGEGSSFALVLPLALAEIAAETSAPVGRDDPADPASLPGVRILAADDNATNRLVLRTLLQQDGVELTVVEDGAQAVDAWRGGGFDVVLMDVQMPVMDGPTAARTIRDEEVRLGRPRIPIVALTANVMSHQLAEYRDAGMDAHVAKPIELAMLFEVLDQVLGEAPSALAA